MPAPIAPLVTTGLVMFRRFNIYRGGNYLPRLTLEVFRGDSEEGVSALIVN